MATLSLTWCTTMLINAAAWILIALGIGHTVLGLWWFRAAIAEAAADGLLFQFGKGNRRQLAFWFILFGPLLCMAGHLCLLAAAQGNLEILRVLGFYITLVAIAGCLFLRRSPFWLAMLVAPIVLATGFGADLP